MNHIIEKFDREFSQGISQAETAAGSVSSQPEQDIPEVPPEESAPVQSVTEYPAQSVTEQQQPAAEGPTSSAGTYTTVPGTDQPAIPTTVEPEVMDEPEITEPETSETEDSEATDRERPYQDLYDTMVSYNESLARDGQHIVDAWSYEQEPFDLSSWPLLSSGEPTIGYIEIPDMNIVLPLFLGASPSNLEKGAAVLSQTSMPVGGESSNCVIAGHRGWNGSAYFQYVENMKLGSRVYVTNPWETLVYECTEIKIVYPDDVKSVYIRPGRDMITLFTCHPYVIGGGPYRYLVFCERVDTEERKAAADMKNPRADEPAERLENVPTDTVGVVASVYEDVITAQPEDIVVHRKEEEPSVSEEAGEPDISSEPDEPAGEPGSPEPSSQPDIRRVFTENSPDLLELEGLLRIALPIALACIVILILLRAFTRKRKKKKRKKQRKRGGRPPVHD